MKKVTLGTSIAAIIGMGLSSAALSADYTVSVTNLTRGMHFTPLIAAAHSPSASMFRAGTSASAELQAIAEGGDTSGMNSLLESIGASIANGDGLVAPGATVTLQLSDNGHAGNSVFSLASMLLPTNDGFVGLNSVYLPMEDGQSVTYDAIGYDAGTEANDEIIGSGAPGQPGFPAPPPVVATGTGTGGSGVHTSVEGFVHVHKQVVGDLSESGGVSDINQAVHGWLNPVARITITRMGGTDGGDGPSAVSDLTGQVYSATALEIFWQPASSPNGIAAYEITRDGALVDTRDGRSFFEEGLHPDTEYHYEVRAIDSNGAQGAAASISLRTRAQ